MKVPEEFRRSHAPPYISRPGDLFGCFIIPGHKAPGRRQLNIIACDGLDTGWDHVSVSLDNSRNKPPTWDEMCFVKDLFWNEDEWVVQFHPAKADYVNKHPGVLHLWKSVQPFPTPPKICV